MSLLKSDGLLEVPSVGHRPRVFDVDAEMGRARIDYLESLIDEPTKAFLSELDPQPGQRCLDVGAGAGSITRWLAAHAWPHGLVIGIDTDTEYLAGLAREDGIEVMRHDLDQGLPISGQFDLIHARLTMMNLHRREEVLAELVSALAPGGWLVVGDFSNRHPEALSVPTTSDIKVWNRIQHLTYGVTGPLNGEDWNWAHEADGHLVSAGLVNVQGVEYSRVAQGGTPGCLLHHAVNRRVEPQLLEAGVHPADITRYRQLMLDPRFRAWFYQFVCTRGQKPVNRFHRSPR